MSGRITTALSGPSAIVLAAPGTTVDGMTLGSAFATEPATVLLPRRDAACAAVVPRRPFEPRPQNALANHTVPAGPVPWSKERDQTYWKRWIANRNRVTGNYVGTTDAILRWAACKWGLDENVLRAVAVRESGWRESEVGDNGESFGIMQIKDHTSDGRPDLGGFPATLHATALTVDLYGSWIRSCLEGAFYDGGDWLYHGKRVVDDLWGCAGAWYSGSWHDAGAEDYVVHIRAIVASRGWLHLRG